MSLRIYIYDKTNGLSVYDSLESIELSHHEATIWIDIATKSRELLESVASRFKLHELTLEDSLTPDHLPKIENYGNHLFMIIRSLAPQSVVEQEDEEDRDHSEEEEFTRQIGIYLSSSFIITVRSQDIPWLDAIGRQVRQYPERELAVGPEALAHRIIDIAVDRFERGLEVFDREIDELEEVVFDNPDDFEMYDILDLKRELVALRQIAREQRMLILRLINEGSGIISKEWRRYFRDIDDQALGVINYIAKLIDNLQGVRDAYFAFANVRLGDTMRILAVITTILAPLNVIVGIYGMNFKVMPLLHSPHGFWIVMVLQIFITLLLLVYFRKKRWI
ncbi:MAG: magnesium and cobalt transport protein CorA [Candidatus Dadabacteria bacterium]|nr:MAG: magnesium and cobalt transport protein CorA [Candidatus Dadabacteria bacterium]